MLSKTDNDLHACKLRKMCPFGILEISTECSLLLSLFLQLSVKCPVSNRYLSLA